MFLGLKKEKELGLFWTGVWVRIALVVGVFGLFMQILQEITKGQKMTRDEAKEFNKRCLESYNEYTCKDCKHFKAEEKVCGMFTDDTDSLNVNEDFTCKQWTK